MAIVYILKKYIELKSKHYELDILYRNKLSELEAAYKHGHRGKIDDKLLQYSQEQVKVLLEVYRTLYEGQLSESTSAENFQEIISDSDKKILKPITDYRAFLSKKITDPVYTVHSILAQFKESTSKESLISFLKFRHEFFRLMQRAIENVQTRCTKA
jgi:hypothetical protein